MDLLMVQVHAIKLFIHGVLVSSVVRQVLHSTHLF